MLVSCDTLYYYFITYHNALLRKPREYEEKLFQNAKPDSIIHQHSIARDHPIISDYNDQVSAYAVCPSYIIIVFLLVWPTCRTPAVGGLTVCE